MVLLAVLTIASRWGPDTLHKGTPLGVPTSPASFVACSQRIGGQPPAQGEGTLCSGSPGTEPGGGHSKGQRDAGKRCLLVQLLVCIEHQLASDICHVYL